MRVLILTCFLNTLAFMVVAQKADSIAIRNYYNEHAILWTGGLNKYYQNNKAYPMSQMGEVIKFSPEALVEFKRFKQNRSVTVSLLAASVGLLASSFFVSSRDARIGLAAASVVTATISLPFSAAWTKHLKRMEHDDAAAHCFEGEGRVGVEPVARDDWGRERCADVGDRGEGGEHGIGKKYGRKNRAAGRRYPAAVRCKNQRGATLQSAESGAPKLRCNARPSRTRAGTDFTPA